MLNIVSIVFKVLEDLQEIRVEVEDSIINLKSPSPLSHLHEQIKRQEHLCHLRKLHKCLEITDN